MSSCDVAWRSGHPGKAIRPPSSANPTCRSPRIVECALALRAPTAWRIAAALYPTVGARALPGIRVTMPAGARHRQKRVRSAVRNARTRY
ncbi:hypothetical protein GQ57_33320 [Burkholderia sp. MSh2]|nr:hypothetical protein GQ57_33320 [Burkholderia sp. MSh2]